MENGQEKRTRRVVHLQAVAKYIPTVSQQNALVPQGDGQKKFLTVSREDREPATKSDILDVISMLCLTLGIDLSEDRQAALALALDGRMTQGELTEACEHLALSSELSEKLRYGGSLTPADFLSTKKATRSSGAIRMEARRDAPLPPPGSIDAITRKHLLEEGWSKDDFEFIGVTAATTKTYLVTNTERAKRKGAWIPWINNPNKP